MAKKEVYLIIGVIVFLLIWKFGTFNIFSIFQPTVQGFVQWTGRPSCSGSPCDFAKENLVYSTTTQFNTGKNIFRFDSTVDSIEKRKSCKTFPNICSGNIRSLNVVATAIDSDGCQHWSYDTTTIAKFEDTYGGSCTSTTNIGGWNFYLSGGSCQWTHSVSGDQPRVCLWNNIHYSDYGGREIRTADESGNPYRGCYQEIKVYKNNNLIDTIYSNSGDKYKVYYDDTFKSSGVAIDSSQTSWFYNSICSSFQNEYDIIFANNSYVFNISTPKKNYTEGENILLEVSVLNTLATTSYGTLEIVYEVPTILGNKNKTQSQEVSIKTGVNLFSYSIPTTEPVRVLKVKPQLIIKYPTNTITGVNYNFKTGTLYPISYYDKFELGLVEEDWSTISVTSLAGYYQEKLNLTEKELRALNLSLNEKISLVNQYKNNLDEQSKLIDSLSKTISEKANIINSLNLNIQEQANLINKLELTQSEQASLISQLQLTVDEQAELIKEMKLTVDKQAGIINNLNLTVSQQAELIKEMKLTSDNQIGIITNLDLTISQQAELINKLNLNLQDKIILVSQLQTENDKQAELIKEMKLSFSNQVEIINGLDKKVSDDVEIIKNLGLTSDEQVKLISQLRLTNEQLGELVSSLKLTNLQQVELINSLRLTNLQLGELISDFNLTIIQQAELINKLDKTVQEKGEIIANLNLSVNEDAEMIKSYKLTIDQEAIIISQLNLKLEDEKKLVNLLYSEISKQQELLNKTEVAKNETIPIEPLIEPPKEPDYLIYSLIGALIVGGIYIIYKRKK